MQLARSRGWPGSRGDRGFRGRRRRFKINPPSLSRPDRRRSLRGVEASLDERRKENEVARGPGAGSRSTSPFRLRTRLRRGARLVHDVHAQSSVNVASSACTKPHRRLGSREKVDSDQLEEAALFFTRHKCSTAALAPTIGDASPLVARTITHALEYYSLYEIINIDVTEMKKKM